MPSSQHEALHRIFRDKPELYAHAFKMLNIDFPTPKEVAVVDTDLTVISPIERPEACTDAVLAMYSALTHARSPKVDAILKALDVALTTIDTDTAKYIAEQTEIGLGDTQARQIWRRLMTMQNYRFKSEFAEMLRDEGRAEGEARSVLKVLERRGVPVTESIRERIMACTDRTLVDSWLIRSLEVATAEELFD